MDINESHPLSLHKIIQSVTLALLGGIAISTLCALAADPSLPNSTSTHHGRIQITLVEKKSRSSSPLDTLKMMGSEGSEEEVGTNDNGEKEEGHSLSSSFLDEPLSGYSKKEIYLTFDDGPINGTQNVLRILKEEGVAATMFFVGRHIRKRPQLFAAAQKISRLMIANHTYSHANGHYQRFYHNLYGVISDIEHAQLIIGGRKYLRLAGRNVWRIPEVSRDDHALKPQEVRIEHIDYDLLAREGFFVYGWDAEWRFDHLSGKPLFCADVLAKRIKSLLRQGRSVKKGKIVLLAHDFMFRDAQSSSELRRFIHLMRGQGWSFKSIDQYSKVQPEPLYVAKYYKKSPVKMVLLEAKTSQSEQPSAPSKHGPQPAAARKDSPEQEQRSIQARLNDAVRSYAASKVENLLDHGARINRRDEYGRIALNTAIKANSIVLVKKLLANGADLSQKDGYGTTALEVAREYRRKAIEKYLIEVSLRKDSKHVASVQDAILQPRNRNPLAVLR